MTTNFGETLPTLSTPRQCLRPLTASDANALYEIFCDSQVMRFWSSLPWTTLAQADALIEDVTRAAANGSLYQWGVVLKPNDRVVGTCTLAQIDTQNRRAEIGFALHPHYGGQGLMTEAVRTVLQFAFDEMNLHRIEADVDPRNLASIKLLERLGFQREGYLRERWLVGNEISDTVFYGLLRQDRQ